MSLEGSICLAPTFIIAFANCINLSLSTALNGLTCDTTNATELFNTVSFITFDKLMSDLLKYAVTLGDIFELYLHHFKCSFKCVVPLVDILCFNACTQVLQITYPIQSLFSI